MTREEAINAITQFIKNYAYGNDLIGLNMAIEALKDERPHGEWIKGKEISRTMLAGKTLYIDYEDFTCSNCGLVLDRLLYHVDGSPIYNFCPNCGAKMTH